MSNKGNDRESRAKGLDLARLIALALVSWQHIQSLCDIDPKPIFFNLDSGQTGVAIFFGLSGLSIGYSRTKHAGTWLLRRFARIFIPYWITLSLLFTANYFVKYKQVTTSLVICQYLGVAGFTHHAELVGVHLWFISLLLLCYLFGSLILRWKSSFWTLLGVIFIWSLIEPHFGGHALAYMTGVAFGLHINKATRYVIPTAVIATSLMIENWQVSTAACLACYLAMLFMWFPLPKTRMIDPVMNWVATQSYHYYLIHGLCYLSVSKLFNGNIWITALGGTICSVIAADTLLIVEKKLLAQYQHQTSKKSTVATQ